VQSTVEVTLSGISVWFFDKTGHLIGCRIQGLTFFDITKAGFSLGQPVLEPRSRLERTPLHP
jgi:hypothetical protein